MEKVLIVDDMEMNRAILMGILRNDYQLIEAENGREALSIIEEQKDELSIVLLDLMMPEVDGFGVLKVMKEQKWIEKLPVLVITGEDAVGTEEQCFAYGVSDFIRKPFNNMLVKMRVRNIAKLFQYKNELEHITDEQILDLQEQE